MRLHWTADWNMIGNGFGYSTHQRMLRAALERAGVEMSPDSPVAVHIIVPPNFEPVPGKFNILYTMYEGQVLPDEWIMPVQLADLVVVPCRHNMAVFKQYTDRPVEYCWEGVDTDQFAFVERTFPKAPEPFRYLWVGASNPRKGYEHVCLAWAMFLQEHPKEAARSVLVMKTTQDDRKERLVRFPSGNAYVDTRVYSLQNLAALYQISHCFLFPTMGEGFGLTLAEAMSTGLPCIYTDWSGPKDFISEREGYPLRFVMKETGTVKRLAIGKTVDYHRTISVSADVEHLVRRMVQVQADYAEALRRGRRAAERIRRDITWERSAESFMDIVERHTGERRKAA